MSVLLVVLQFALVAVLAIPTSTLTFTAAAVLPMVLGLVCGVAALAANRPGNFNIRPDPKPGGRLIETGPYRYIRHPMYLAVLLIGIGAALADPRPWRLAALVALALVLHIKATVEERAMLARHPGYAAYRARTARLVPFLW